MKNQRPVIGITMGDPVGIGPEIILSAMADRSMYNLCKPIVFGDCCILESAKEFSKSRLKINMVKSPENSSFLYGKLDVLNLSMINASSLAHGVPTPETGKAMIDYIKSAIDMAKTGMIDAMVTAPINKMAMKLAGSRYAGHTELLADRTDTCNFAMMLAGEKLRVILVTIHIPLAEVPSSISRIRIKSTIEIAAKGLYEKFGINNPRIAVAALNPHGGEGGIFGHEEDTIIKPAIIEAKYNGLNVEGPFPPDTVFHYAAKGNFDVVVSMYHDQGLIPFKLLHFDDGVNTTLGLPIIRTSVDHGTAYDIAGKGIASPASLKAAIRMAVQQVTHNKSR